jgi:hypothetical protein
LDIFFKHRLSDDTNHIDARLIVWQQVVMNKHGLQSNNHYVKARVLIQTCDIQRPGSKCYHTTK